MKPLDAALAKRKLAAVLCADVEGYSRLMGADEAGTHATLTAYRKVLADTIAEHGGRVVGTAGDSVLADFPSVVEALRAAVDIQAQFAERNAELPADRRLRFRIGINLGDVIVDGEDIFGDGVNVAARVQALAEPGGIAVSGAVYDQVRNKLDLGFRDRGTHRVKNIAEPVRVYGVMLESPAARRAARVARGFWLVAIGAGAAMVVLALAVTAWLHWPQAQRSDRAEPGSRTEAEPAADPLQPTSAVGARPAIAVLPFDNQGGEPEQDYFSDGITEDIISALGRFSNLQVMSFDAVAPYKGQTVTPERLSEDLEVRYVVDGSVRRAGDQLRVTTRLTDAGRGVLLWSERYDRTMDDIFAVQDDITRQIVSTLAIRVSYLEQERAFGTPTENLNAYDYYLRGRQSFRQFTRAGNVRAQELFERAIELDHNYGDAYAALAWTYTKSAEMGWTEWPDQALERAHDLAQSAVRLDSTNQLGHILLAIVHTYRQNYELALGELDRAVKANPNHAGNHAERGWVLLAGGRPGDAIAALEEAVRFDPSPTPNTFSNLGMAYYLRGRYDDAVSIGQSAVGRYPHHVMLYIVLAAAYAETGQLDAAARAADELRRLHPFFEVDSFGQFFRDPAERDRLRASLRKAGL
ncbi:MAG TPA: adenylate/guanylate cyclase domain-containing protein [Geminicoccaceae bacterium]